MFFLIPLELTHNRVILPTCAKPLVNKAMQDSALLKLHGRLCAVVLVVCRKPPDCLVICIDPLAKGHLFW